MKSVKPMIQAGLAEMSSESSEWKRLIGKENKLVRAIEHQVFNFCYENRDYSPKTKEKHFALLMRNNRDIIKKYMTVKNNEAEVAKRMKSTARRMIQYCNISDSPKAPTLAGLLGHIVNKIEVLGLNH